MHRVLVEEEILNLIKNDWTTETRYRDVDALINYRISHELIYDVKSSISLKKKNILKSI